MAIAIRDRKQFVGIQIFFRWKMTICKFFPWKWNNYCPSLPVRFKHLYAEDLTSTFRILNKIWVLFWYKPVILHNARHLPQNHQFGWFPPIDSTPLLPLAMISSHEKENTMSHLLRYNWSTNHVHFSTKYSFLGL